MTGEAVCTALTGLRVSLSSWVGQAGLRQPAARARCQRADNRLCSVYAYANGLLRPQSYLFDHAREKAHS
ncbi:MAG: hypothetical protein D3922_12870 [Candidatus Electrothrix sp. AR1]|nr:hypothetical protein [Candidatus Electrothrix sp. AR1]